MMPRGGKADIFESYTGRPGMERLKYLIRALPDQVGAYERALSNGQNDTSPEAKALVDGLTEMATNKIFDPKTLKNPAIVDKILALCTQPMREQILGLTKNTHHEEVIDQLFRAVFTSESLTFRSGSVDALTETLKNGRVLRELGVDLYSISVMGAQFIASALASNGSVERLHLAFLGLTHDIGLLAIPAKALSYRAFASILPGSNIKQVAMANCPFGAEGVKAVALALRENGSVTSFYIGGSFLGESDVAGIAEMISTNQTLTTLAMPGCNIIPRQTSFAETKRRFTAGIHPFNMIVDSLATNTTITQLNIKGIHATDTQQAGIEGYLARNRESAGTNALSFSSRSTSSITPTSESSGSRSPSSSRWFGGLTRRWSSVSSTVSGSASPSSKPDVLSAGSSENLGSPQKAPASPVPPRRSPSAQPPE